MEKYRLGILGLGETHWKGQKDFVSDGMRIILSGGDECERGVGIICNEEVARRVAEVH